MHWTDEAAEQLEKILHDPLADAVRGQAEVVSVSAPSGRGRYQEATVELELSAPGLPGSRITTTGVFAVKAWPTVGFRAPARVPPSDPASAEVDWSALAG
ncbi:hypothetical protein [Microbacterium sp. SORGH_AS_0888]|uniref:hypothetical protein n=1 Tax=Microbacterium sp. SORGH_AS_0888 TaxID=3041791 RepID=UPI00278976AF|nr:hypothetical protein [Microbacterium sp. SORGH_AS_0888]MDQ1128917.1 hypothetical protein [Microbacterium sp. SORGH_AS_0888]